MNLFLSERIIDLNFERANYIVRWNKTFVENKLDIIIRPVLSVRQFLMIHMAVPFTAMLSLVDLNLLGEQNSRKVFLVVSWVVIPYLKAALIIDPDEVAK